MRVKSIYLENVRGLPTIALDFTDPVTGQIRTRTVIAGSNGTGKTTILDAIYAIVNGSETSWRTAWLTLVVGYVSHPSLWDDLFVEPVREWIATTSVTC